jgi:hypothetical protein
MNPLPPTFMRYELQRLNVLLHREVLRLRAAHLVSPGELRGLHLSDAHVDVLLREARSELNESAPAVESLTVEADRLREAIRAEASRDSPLARLAALFGLEDFERDVLLLAVAPELNLRYEVLCSYLNNDVTRKRPNSDLALRLFCGDEAEGWTRRRHFTSDAPLFRHGLLQWLPENAESPASSLARAFCAPPRLVHWLLGIPFAEPVLARFTVQSSPRREWSELLLPADLIAQLRVLRTVMEHSARMIPVFEGADGSGKQSSIEALCAELGRKLLTVDIEALMTSAIELAEAMTLLGREQRLASAFVCLRRSEAFFDADGRVLPKARSLGPALAECDGPVVLACRTPCDFKALLPDTATRVMRFVEPPFDLRRQLWRRELTAAFGSADGADTDALSNRFTLNGGQIRAAVGSARDVLRMHGIAREFPSRKDLFTAAREQSQQHLRSLAQRIEPLYGWDDLVLPAETLRQLREIEDAVKHRHTVLESWGFKQRLSLGRGLKSLFTGASGTGKTMAAEVLAHELGLDLYKIDLASLVSKYIGETEKNLDRVFRAAHNSNAILFFDEADALFGKRSEVRDAHDRYANIEVAYLLQKTEEYEGFVILATNLAPNLDEAFKRRINYAVDFPFPDEPQRERLWRAMFPARTPLGDDLDFGFLARQFALAGGNIKSAALAAAFLAAADGGVVRMSHLMQAVAREWRKLGKLASATEFKSYIEQVKFLPETTKLAANGGSNR